MIKIETAEDIINFANDNIGWNTDKINKTHLSSYTVNVAIRFMLDKITANGDAHTGEANIKKIIEVAKAKNVLTNHPEAPFENLINRAKDSNLASIAKLLEQELRRVASVTRFNL